MKTITITDILIIVRRYLILLILAPLLAAGGTYLYLNHNYSVVETYTSSATLYILFLKGNSSTDVQYDTSSAQYFASDFRELLTHSTVIEETRTLLGYDRINESITVNAISGTRLFQVVVTGANPQRCMDIANTTSELFRQFIMDTLMIDGVTITQKAALPSIPNQTPKMDLHQVGVAALAAFAFVFGIGLAIEMFNTKLKTENQIEETLKQPALGSIWDYRTALKSYLNQKNDLKTTLYQSVPESTKESVKAAALNIRFAAVGKSMRSIALTSPMSGDGKSSLSLLLAGVYAEEGKTVLLIDADFRNPTLSRLLKKKGTHDLLDHLVGRATLQDTIQPTHMRDVFFIDSHHNSSLLSRIIQSEEFDHFLLSMQESYDLIIFDTPPLGLFIDAAVIASKVDGMVVVVPTEKVEPQRVKAIIDQLSKSSAHVLGILLNFVPFKKSKDSYYYYRN
ncbi:Etk tyrosine kinase [Clostridia bacterium]|nr:Etk tyrosine kinase [Clostridia bacterium]